ncbi:MAG: hypothetical protein OZ921_07580 [Sorangiineae bacterium]|nr:hypothetical protein [Polyangiaceae bacterium]MEB2322358.1 hypothetical protein [Sorangiineae bacterium]
MAGGVAERGPEQPALLAHLLAGAAVPTADRHDADSLAARREQARSLIDESATLHMRDDALPGLLSTGLHETTHNLDPSHEYTFQGKTDSQAFGGGLSSMMEESEAQSGVLYYLELLVKKGLITEELRRQSCVDGVVWAFGYIAPGMTNEDGTRKPHSQLAAIQPGVLMGEGAVVWGPSAPAANGRDVGAFKLDFEKFPTAFEKLMRDVARVKARNGKKGAKGLTKKCVEGDEIPPGQARRAGAARPQEPLRLFGGSLTD